MKVIVAGFPKTGTKSMQAALSLLGYKVYDVVESVVLHQDEYVEILHKGWSTEDFRQMYENVDAVTDIPACYFWDEIHKAFPEAKIILTTRENEDIWWRSLANQLRVSHQLPVQILEYFSPTLWRARTKIMDMLVVLIFGLQPYRPFTWTLRLNEQLAKKLYRTHNAYVLQTAPKDKLLIYKCSDGWQPLCEFLSVPVPDCPFPRKNVRGNIYNELQDDPLYQRMQREFKFSLAKYGVMVAVVSYFSYKYGPINCILAICHRTRGVIDRLWSCL